MAGELCAECEALGIQEALTTSLVKEAVPLYRGYRFEEQNRTDCPLCHLLATVDDVVIGYALFLVDNGVERKNAKLEREVWLVVDSIYRHDARNRQPLSLKPGLFTILPRNDPQRETLLAAKLNGRNVNWKQVKTWLTHCQDQHQETCCLTPLDQPFPIRFLDCLERFVVRSKPGMDYVTLSYVWSQSEFIWNRPIMETRSPNALPADGMLEVVKDAMAVVLKLGLRYLWVDRYCIDQTNPEEKHNQILGMDKIYEHAKFTIVAAAGDGSQHGLPGVGHRARKAQPSCIVGNASISSTMKPLPAVLKNSAWNTRGWTYQEAVLSTRCLFFTDEQVHFTCRAMTCRETLDLIEEATLTTPGLLNPSILNDSHRHVPLGGKPLQALYEHLENYKSRHLTYESDILNGFQGILSKSGYKHLWGVPIAPPDFPLQEQGENIYEASFLHGLLWAIPNHDSNASGSSLRRCRSYPSWSWAGWIGPIQSPHWKMSGMPLSTVQLEMRDGTLLRLSDFNKLDLTPDFQRQMTHIIRIETLVVKFRFKAVTDDENSGTLSPRPESKVGNQRAFGQLYEYPNSTNGSQGHESWDCLLICKTFRWKCLLIDWAEDEKGEKIAHVIGNVSLPAEYLSEKPESLESLRRTIRLR